MNLDRLTAEVLDPAGIAPGTVVAGQSVLGVSADGRYVRLDLAGGLAVLAGPRTDADAAFLRTARWNLLYQADHLDAARQAVIREVGRLLEASTPAALDAAALDATFFQGPPETAPSQLPGFLQVGPGRTVALRVTDTCNEDCLFCFATDTISNVIRGHDEIIAALQAVELDRLDDVILTGGEPSMVRDLPRIVQAAAERGARRIAIQTNMWEFRHPGALEALLPWRHLVSFNAALHGMDAPTSDLMAGCRGHHEGRVQALDRAVALGFHVSILMVVMRPNLDQVPGFVRWAASRWNIPHLEIHLECAMLRGSGWRNRELVVSQGECMARFVEGFRYGREAGVRVNSTQLCGALPCIYPPEYRDHQQVYADFTGKTNGEDWVKPAATCEGCRLDPLCPGVYRRYLERFGTGELRRATDDATAAYVQRRLDAMTRDGETPAPYRAVDAADIRPESLSPRPARGGRRSRNSS